MRRLPAVHALRPTDTLVSLSDEYFGAYDAWRVIAEENGIRTWGMATPLMLMGRFKHGGNVRIPKLGS